MLELFSQQGKYHQPIDVVSSGHNLILIKLNTLFCVELVILPGEGLSHKKGRGACRKF